MVKHLHMVKMFINSQIKIRTKFYLLFHTSLRDRIPGLPAAEQSSLIPSQMLFHIRSGTECASMGVKWISEFCFHEAQFENLYTFFPANFKNYHYSSINHHRKPQSAPQIPLSHGNVL